jgi:hypothetical protein
MSSPRWNGSWGPMLTEADSWRIAIIAVDYDALPFLHIGEFGLQPVFMPHKVYPWRETTKPPRRKPRSRSIKR